MLIAHPNLKAILGTCDAHVDGSKAAMEIMQDGGPIKVLALNSPNDVGRAAAGAMVSFLVDGTTMPSKHMIIEGGVVTPDNVDGYMDIAF